MRFLSKSFHLARKPCGHDSWNETSIGPKEGKVKDIAVISLVGKSVCFKVVAVNEKSNPPLILLSRRLAQESAGLPHGKTARGCYTPQK